MGDVYLTLTIGDKRDNFELVRLGGRGGVLPQVDSALKVVDREGMRKFLGCLTVDSNGSFDRVCENAEIW